MQWCNIYSWGFCTILKRVRFLGSCHVKNCYLEIENEVVPFGNWYQPFEVNDGMNASWKHIRFVPSSATSDSIQDSCDEIKGGSIPVSERTLYL